MSAADSFARALNLAVSGHCDSRPSGCPSRRVSCCRHQRGTHPVERVLTSAHHCDRHSQRQNPASDGQWKPLCGAAPRAHSQWSTTVAAPTDADRNMNHRVRHAQHPFSSAPLVVRVDVRMRRSGRMGPSETPSRQNMRLAPTPLPRAKSADWAVLAWIACALWIISASRKRNVWVTQGGFKQRGTEHNRAQSCTLHASPLPLFAACNSLEEETRRFL